MREKIKLDVEWVIRKEDLLRGIKEARKIYALRPNNITTDEGEWERIEQEVRKFNDRLDPEYISLYWDKKKNTSKDENIRNTYEIVRKVTQDTARIPKCGYFPGFGYRI